MKRLAISALILAPLAFAGVAIASSHGADKFGGHHGMRGHRGPPPIERIAEELDLDAAQTDQLTALAESFRASHEARRDAHDGFRTTAAEELRLEQPDFDKLASLAAAEADEAHALHLESIDAIADFASTLTPDQRARLADHLENGPPHGPHGMRGDKPGDIRDRR